MISEELVEMYETGVPANGLPVAAWEKSTFSQGNSNCVEVGDAGAWVAFRDSKNPGGPALVFTPGEMSAFVQGVREGQFDHFVI